MRRTKGAALLMALIVLCMAVVGCTEIQNPANAPFAYNEYQGKNYEDIVAELEAAGFQNIKTETMLTFSESKEYTVGGVTIDGNHTFRKGAVYEATVPVIVSYYKMQEQEEPSTDTQPSTSGTDATDSTQADPIPQEEMDALLNKTLQAAFDEEYSIELEGYLYTVNLWHEGIAATATLAKDGNAEAMDTWTSLKKSASDMCASLCELLSMNGHDDKMVSVNILNDINRENVLFTTFIGMETYDWVTE